MFVIILRYLKPIEEMDRLRPPHLTFLDEYYAKNVFLASGRQNPATGGIILAHGVTRDKLDEIIRQDPFHKENAATYEVIEFIPNKYAPFFSGVLG